MHNTPNSSRRSSIAFLAASSAAFWLIACDEHAPRTPGGSADHAHADHRHDDHEHEQDGHSQAQHDEGHGEPGHEHAAVRADDPAQADHAHADEVTLSVDAIQRAGIRIETAQVRVLRPTFVAPARVAFNADAMAHVGAPLAGRVVELKAKLGDRVQKGDALIAIESPELGAAQAEYFQKRIEAEAAGPAADLAKAVWERAKSLYDEAQGISLTQVQEREAQYKAALAELRSAQAAVVGAENRLHILGMSQQATEDLARTGEITPRFTIFAPIAGTVIEREVTLGELVGPDREALLVLADTTSPWILADVPEARLHETSAGAAAWITVGTVADESSRRLEGSVRLVAPLVDAATRTAQVRIELASAPAWLKPGMFAQVEIESTPTGDEPSASLIAIPDAAVQTVEGRAAVFVPVAGEEGTFAVRPVRIGPIVHGMVQVYEGLHIGESYAASGTFILKAELGKGSAAHEH